MNRPRTLIFDLDDTLYPASKAYDRGLAAAIRHLRREAITQLSENELNRRYVSARTQAKQALPPHHSSSHNRVLYFKRLLEDLLGQSRPKLLLELLQTYETAMLSDLRLLEADRLKRLKQRFAIALVTDETALTQIKKLSVLDPEGDLFPVVVTSEECGREKPDPFPFQEALRRLGVQASEAAMIGDHFEKDAMGASQLGISSWWVCEASEPKKSWPGMLGQGPLSEALGYFEGLTS